jgi:hypothetical protein
MSFRDGEILWGEDFLVRRFDAGRLVFTHMRLLEHLGLDPVADRLFVNMLRHFGRRSVPSDETPSLPQTVLDWSRRERADRAKLWCVIGPFANWDHMGHETAYPPEHNVDLGAVHAGWRGALAGVTDQAIAAMISLGARIGGIAAAVGPCIGRASYEVDDDFATRLIADDPGNERFFGEGRGGKWHFDLEAYVVARLAAAGIQQIEAVGLDTYALEDRFFSYRRATHRNEPTYGRQLSLIGLAS